VRNGPLDVAVVIFPQAYAKGQHINR